jgi:hypothetical protein
VYGRSLKKSRRKKLKRNNLVGVLIFGPYTYDVVVCLASQERDGERAHPFSPSFALLTELGEKRATTEREGEGENSNRKKYQ